MDNIVIGQQGRIDWEEAVADFLLQTRATREEKTEAYYRIQ